MGIMVMAVSAACGDKREKAESETLKTKNIVNGSEFIAETEKVSKVENSKDNEKIQQNTEPAEQINTEQIKPDKTDIQSSPSTEKETKNEIKRTALIIYLSSFFISFFSAAFVFAHSSTQYSIKCRTMHTEPMGTKDQKIHSGQFNTKVRFWLASCANTLSIP